MSWLNPIYLNTQEFAKSRTIRDMRASVVYVPKCPRANFSFLRANVPINVPRVCQFLNLVCERAKDVPIFQLFFKRIGKLVHKMMYRHLVVKTL